MQLCTNICDRGLVYEQFVLYCRTKLVPMMQLDVSKYAPNRHRLWLINEPYLGKQSRLKTAYNDPYLDRVIQWLYPGCNTALISYHGQIGNINSNAQIDHHRDTSFASNMARMLNLGNVSHFSYSLCRRNNERNACTSFLLHPGDLIEFDCKHLHACTYAASERMSLVMWKLKPNYEALLSQTY